jgi:hypothetical protein
MIIEKPHIEKYIDQLTQNEEHDPSELAYYQEMYANGEV